MRRRDLERLSGQPVRARRETAARIRDTGATLAEALPRAVRAVRQPGDDLATLKRLRARADGASRERFLQWVRRNPLKDRLDPEAAEVLRDTAPAVRRRDLGRLSGQPVRVRRETAARIRDNMVSSRDSGGGRMGKGLEGVGRGEPQQGELP